MSLEYSDRVLRQRVVAVATAAALLLHCGSPKFEGWNDDPLFVAVGGKGSSVRRKMRRQTLQPHEKLQKKPQEKQRRPVELGRAAPWCFAAALASAIDGVIGDLDYSRFLVSAEEGCEYAPKGAIRERFINKWSSYAANILRDQLVQSCDQDIDHLDTYNFINATLVNCLIGVDKDSRINFLANAQKETAALFCVEGITEKAIELGFIDVENESDEINDVMTVQAGVGGPILFVACSLLGLAAGVAAVFIQKKIKERNRPFGTNFHPIRADSDGANLESVRTVESNDVKTQTS